MSWGINDIAMCEVWNCYLCKCKIHDIAAGFIEYTIVNFLHLTALHWPLFYYYYILTPLDFHKGVGRAFIF